MATFLAAVPTPTQITLRMDQIAVPENTEPARPRIRVTEAMQLAAVPFIGYACAFGYEAGYLSWFGVPYWLVRLDLMHVFLTITAIGVVLASLLNYTRLLPVRLLSVLVHWTLPTFGVLAAVWIVRQTRLDRSWVVAGRLLIVLILGGGGLIMLYELVVLPVRLYKNAGDWLERWRRGAIGYYRRWYRFPYGTVGEHVASKGVEILGPEVMRLATSLWVAVAGLYILGWYRAKELDRFTLLRKPTPCVALRRYGEGVLCVDVDTELRQIKSTFRVIPFVDTGTVYQLVRLGQLQSTGDAAGRPKAVPPVK